MTRRLVVAVIVVILVGAGFVLTRGMAAAPLRTVPTTRVQRGKVQVTVYTVGDLRAARSVQLATPPMGGQLQIVQLADSGAAVHAGDVVVEFDSAEQEFNLEQARFDLQLAQQGIVKAESQAAVQIAEDEVAVLHARYDVR